MASILKVDDLRGNTAAGDITITSEGGSATMQLQQGLVKAWGYLNGDNTTFYDSFGISSASDESTGVIDFTLSSAMSSSNYACAGAAGQNDGGYASQFNANNQTRTTTVFEVGTGYVVNGAESFADRDSVNFTITGDLA